MPKITIPQKNRIIEVELNSNLMNALIDAGLPVASSCGGDSVCSKCKVKVVGAVNPADLVERDCLKRNKCDDDERLSCQIKVTSDLSVTTRYW